MTMLTEAAAALGLGPGEARAAGRDVLKVPVEVVRARAGRRAPGRLLLVTAMTPTSHGEGKTVTSIGAAMALRVLGHRATVVLRQPSLGPVFGVKGGAAGGGKATVVPSDSINLGLSGDLFRVEAAHNLLSALVNNHLYHDDPPALDPARILWPWTVDTEDRALRHVAAEFRAATRAVRRDSSFVITAASEVMAVLGMARDYPDLKERLGRIVVGFDRAGEAVRARDLRAAGAMAALLRDALEPNLVTTADGTPAIVHGGPFGNLAQGTASRLGIELGLATAEFTVVEAGFASELGAEKFVDIVARSAGLTVDAALLVATIRGLRHQGGAEEAAIDRPDPAAVERGLANLDAHLANLRLYGIPPVLVLNRFPGDGPEEVARLRAWAETEGLELTESTAFADGASGALAVARAAVRAADAGGRNRPVYPEDAPVETSLATLARRVYGADGVEITDTARADLETLRRIGEPNGLVCVAKTPLSLSDLAERRGRPTGYTVRARRFLRSSGAGFTVAYLGPIETMPGLPKRPLAERIDLSDDGRILGVE